jgi:hypothetical protein
MTFGFVLSNLLSFVRVQDLTAASVMMKAVRAPETSVSFYQITRRSNPAHSPLYPQHRVLKCPQSVLCNEVNVT